jgi:hypothetical protein
VTDRINALLAKYERIKNDVLSEELIIVDNMVCFFLGKKKLGNEVLI